MHFTVEETPLISILKFVNTIQVQDVRIFAKKGKMKVQTSKRNFKERHQLSTTVKRSGAVVPASEIKCVRVYERVVVFVCLYLHTVVKSGINAAWKSGEQGR